MRSSLRLRLAGISLVVLLLLAAFGTGLYVGSHNLTTPTAPPWPAAQGR